MADLSIDSHDIPKVVKLLSPMGIIAVLLTVIVASGGWVILQDIVSKEDQIIRELSETRAQIRQLEQEIQQSAEATERRFSTHLRHLELLAAWMRASCYASANGDPEARRYCDEVK